MSTTLTPRTLKRCGAAWRAVPGSRRQLRAQLVAGNQNWSSQIQGTDVELPLIRTGHQIRQLLHGSRTSQSAAKCAVLGQTVADNLFGPDADPTGQIIRVKNQPFKVLGVMAPKGSTGFGQDQDDAVYAPYTTVQKKLQGIQHINKIHDFR
jgi:putative ABC transport system permease protein